MSKKTNKTRPVNISLSDPTIEMLDELQVHFGLMSRSAGISFLINNKHKEIYGEKTEK